MMLNKILMLIHIVVDNHIYIRYHLNNTDEILLKLYQEIFHRIEDLNHINLYLERFEQVQNIISNFLLDIDLINDEKFVRHHLIDRVFFNR